MERPLGRKPFGFRLARSSQADLLSTSDRGRLLNDSEVVIGASVAVPFSLGGHEVHFEGTVDAMPSSSKVSVAFPGERPWLVERERLFVVVALGEGADAAH